MVDLAIEFQTDENIAADVAAKYRDAKIPMIAIDTRALRITARTTTRSASSVGATLPVGPKRTGKDKWTRLS
jgi:hypothetical protein